MKKEATQRKLLDSNDSDSCLKNKYSVLGIPVAPFQIPSLVSAVCGWIKRRDQNRYIAFTGMHGVVEAQDNPVIKSALQGAVVVSDGMPLVWIGKSKGHEMKRRVYGPEFMETFCRETGSQYRHFLFGGAPGVAEKLAAVLKEKYSVNVVGTYCPPFRSLNATEKSELIKQINSSNSDCVWVGLSTPKQELWMQEFVNELNVPVLFGVGAAFDFLAGIKTQAPRWIGDSGLEWLYRLVTEPKRLWKRYILGGSKFILLLLREHFLNK